MCLFACTHTAAERCRHQPATGSAAKPYCRSAGGAFQTREWTEGLRHASMRKISLSCESCKATLVESQNKKCRTWKEHFRSLLKTRRDKPVLKGDRKVILGALKPLTLVGCTQLCSKVFYFILPWSLPHFICSYLDMRALYFISVSLAEWLFSPVSHYNPSSPQSAVVPLYTWCYCL